MTKALMTGWILRTPEVSQNGTSEAPHWECVLFVLEDRKNKRGQP
jgi:hypothetical protein